MQNNPEELGYFLMPKKLQTKEEVIARVCAWIEKDLSNKDRNKETRNPQEIEQAKANYWCNKFSALIAKRLHRDNLAASFCPPLPPVYGPVKPNVVEWHEKEYRGRYGHVRSD